MPDVNPQSLPAGNYISGNEENALSATFGPAKLRLMTPASFDICIAYRIYPGVSKVPFIYPADKLRLTEVGIRTLRQSLGGARAKIFFLLDNCPPEYKAMIIRYFPEPDAAFIPFAGIGNLATFGKQIDLLLEQTDSDLVMFAEDDYVYRKNELPKAIALLRSRADADFVTPYDHLDSYVLPIHTRHRYRTIYSDCLLWRTSASTCLTFLTRKATLHKTRRLFRTYSRGNWDSSLWFSLTRFNVFLPSSLFLLFGGSFYFKILLKSWWYGWSQILFGKSYRLWQPVPSIATHMEKVSLAPGIDWEQVVAESEKG